MMMMKAPVPTAAKFCDGVDKKKSKVKKANLCSALLQAPYL